MMRIFDEHHDYDIDFNSMPDYSISVSFNDSGSVIYVSIGKVNHPHYSIAQLDRAFQVPAFDKETIATKEDLYLSDCTFDSSRQDVFQLLGNPQKTVEGYDEYTDKYQTCYIGNSVVYFQSVDYGDLASGRAYAYSVSDPIAVGPRGIRVGDHIEKVLDVFPGSDSIDFKNITTETAIYVSPDEPDKVTNSAYVNPSDNRAYSGGVYINVDWLYGITFEYEDGTITSITLSEMLD